MKNSFLLVLVHVELCVSRNCADRVLLAVAAEGLRAVGVLATAAVTQGLHDWVDFCFENLTELKLVKLKLN